jgi:predicted PhzF superfamily epimerase YddE/YHI9
MQKIAAENNLAETAFTVPVENGLKSVGLRQK